jgi:hypothetical protein
MRIFVLRWLIFGALVESFELIRRFSKKQHEQFSPEGDM